MTQSTHAHIKRNKLARYPSADHRSLASRRAAFAAQMREMALSDLKQVSERLKELHKELELKDARKWTHYDLAREMGIRPRTFQSWENGEVENSNGKGYDKMARYYSRKLGRKITRQWIVFGATEAAAEPQGGSDEEKLSALSEAVSNLQEQLQEVAAEQARLLAKRASAGGSSAASPSSAKPPGRPPKSKRK
jgi:transcriptional regulator with XRE-family HTH domain